MFSTFSFSAQEWISGENAELALCMDAKSDTEIDISDMQEIKFEYNNSRQTSCPQQAQLVNGGKETCSIEIDNRKICSYSCNDGLKIQCFNMALGETNIFSYFYHLGERKGKAMGIDFRRKYIE